MHATAATEPATTAGRIVSYAQRPIDMPTARHAAANITTACPKTSGTSVPAATPTSPILRTTTTLRARFAAASTIQIVVTIRCRPSAISTLDDAAWLTTMMPAIASTLNGATLPAKAGPIQWRISGPLKPIRHTDAPPTSVIAIRLPSTSVRLSAARLPSLPKAIATGNNIPLN